MPDNHMTVDDKKRSRAALAEAQKQQAKIEATRVADPNEPTGPHLKTGVNHGLTG
jgi:hypothetical protein